MTPRSPDDRRPLPPPAPDARSVEDLLRIQRDLALALGSTSVLDEALNLILDATLKTGRVECGGIYLLDEATGTLRLVVHRGVSQRFVDAVGCYRPGAPHTELVLKGETLYSTSTTIGAIEPNVLEEGIKAIAVLPSRHEGRVVAVMNLASRTYDEIPADARSALEATAAQIGPILARVHVETSLRESLARDVAERQAAARALHDEQILLRELLDLQDKERRLLAYEIHDGCAQLLTGAMMHLEGFRGALEDRPAEAWRLYEVASGLLDEGIAEVRRLIGGLRPPILDESGAAAAIECLVFQMSKRQQVEIAFDSQLSPARLAAPVENTLFRAVQESLGNACRHSESPRIAVRLWEADDRVWAEVRDWGQGFDVATVPAGRFGLQGIRERARVMGGQATIESAAGCGTRVLVELPRILSSGPA